MERKLRDFFNRLLENRMRRAVALVLAIIVTFTTTYTLVLPAITLEKDTAETMSGVSLGGNEQDGDTSTSTESEGSDDSDLDDSNNETVAFDAEAKNENGETEALVHVETDIDTFPAGTTMEATVVTDQEVIDSIAEAAEGEVVAVRAVDLKFTDENGETVQPAEDSQVSVTLSPGEGDSSSSQNEENASDSVKQIEDNKVEEASANQNTETSVVQYSEDKGAEQIESSTDVTFQVEPENDLDQDNAVSFDMGEQSGDQGSQTFALVETVPENGVKSEDLTDVENITKDAESETSGDVGTTENEIEAETGEKPLEENPDVAVAEVPVEEQVELVEEPVIEYQEGVLTAQDESSYIITMTYGPEANIPEGAYLQVKEIVEAETYDTHLEETQKVLNEAAQTDQTTEEGIYAGPTTEEPQFFGTRSLMEDPDAFDRQKAEAETAPVTPEPEIVYARFFDITILDANGNEVPPKAPVKVSIEFLDAKQDEKVIQKADSAQVIHFGKDKTEVMQAETLEDTEAGVSFDADKFSVYGVVYTVDFHWEVDGRMYEFSLPGGGFVSFHKLIEVLGIVGDTNNEENQGNSNAENSENQDAEQTDATLTLNDIEVSEATREFVADVESVAFSNPKLVSVSKAEEDTTVGAIKDGLNLECEYSAELTKEQIAEINAAEVQSGDWALISLKAFDTEESLTVTMKTGEVFEIRVTDAQIQKDFIDAKGDTWTITVIYDDSAEIPDDADLKVREIETGTEEYKGYLNDSAEELGVASEEVSFARFFDIEIIDGNGKKVEPKTPVQVKIAYKDAMETDAFTNIVHFAENGAEIISNVELSDDGTTITYKQDSFSVTGTIQTGNPVNNGIYMVLVEYSGKHYMVNNDGTLSEIDYGKDASGTIDDTKVAVEYPMFWTYYYERGGHLRFASEASGFNSDQTASGYYYKYIDPNSADGIIEEHKNGNADNLLGDTVITYHDNSISNASYNKYIGVVNDGGVLRITGNVDANNAARIELATPANVLPSDPLKHSVNHIDIGFDASATVTVPVAYGDYTLRDSNGNVISYITVDQDHLLDVTVEAGKNKENEIIILPEDMKAAEIKAYRQSDYNLYKNDPEELASHELNDAFYITGYSQNNTTDYSEMQVRVEGSFKAATDIGEADWRYYWDWNYINWVKQQRLSHQVEYVVTLNKTVELPLTIDGYRLYDQDGVPMSVTVNIPLTDSFTYWDTRNECPPVQWDWANWQSGDIATHGMSGMDFRLDGGNVEVRADIVALNITKYIEDTNGNLIAVGSSVSNSFEIYRDADGNPDTVKTLGEENVNYNDYAFLHSRETTIGVGESQNVVHDYQVTPGMYYIRENPDSIQKTITDTSGQEWQYKATEIQTEWVWREGDWITQDDKGRLTKVHTSGTYSGKDTDSYNAIPDVLGSYKNNAGGDEFNGFLEFYVINKYEKVQGDIPEPSQDSMNLQLDKKWDNNGDTDEPDGDASVPFTLHQVKKTTVEGSGSGQATGIKVVLYDTDGVSVLATGYANANDTLSLSFTTNGGYKDGHILIKNIAWSETLPTWKEIASYGGGTDYVQTDANGNITSNMSYVVKEADVFDGQISFKLSNGSSLSGNFSSAPSWNGANGSGGSSSQTTTEVDPVGSGYPKTITLSNTAGWSYLFPNLPTKETIPAENKTIEYSYYLVEGTPTGSAADFTSPEYRVYLDEEYTQQDEKNASDEGNAITGSGITKYVEVTNKKATLTVKKEWLGEEETDAYPPIKFKLYQGVKSGNGVNAGQEYTAETNVPKDANGYYTISAESGWQVEFNNLPVTREDNGTPVEVGYYVEEVNPGESWFNHVTVSYMSSTGNHGSSPQDGGIADNNGTLTIINKLPTYAQITIIKQWFENNNGSWNNVTGDASKTGNYAFGFIVQRKVEVLDANEQPTGEVYDFEDYGSEIVVSQNKVLVNDNEFNVVSQGSIWQYRIQGSGDITQHENNLVEKGYYEKPDGTKVWAKFSYRFMETNAYDLSTVVDGEIVKERSEWETLPWNPKYENSGSQTTISNYPIGEIDVTKNWENEDPDLEIGSKVYFKVYQDGVDITSDIVQHPANYGLYSNQVYTDGNPAHNSIVLIYDGTAWETIRVQGLPILTENSSQYQYKIQEVGYSDRNNNDFWDVSTFLQGYKVDDGSLVVPDNQGQSQAVNSAAPFNTITIENKYIKTETEYEFTKVWQDSTGEGTGWQAPITVILHQTKGDVAAGTDTPTGKTATFTIDPYGATEQGQPLSREFTFDGKTYEWSMIVSHEGAYYTFRIEHLPYKDGDDVLSYYVTEDSLGGYLTSYAFKANEGSPDLTIKTSTTNQEKNNRALDGQYIINKQPGVALPNTGGPGTNLLYLFGIMLTGIAGTGLVMRKKQRDSA